MTPHFQISVAVHTLWRGGVIAYPTESVFGLGCDPHNAEAIERLLKLKHRPANAGLILIAASFAQAAAYLKHTDAAVLSRIRRSWPGAVTWVVPSHDVHPLITGGRGTVAIRVPDHPVCQALCEKFGGAIVSTSANITGRKPAKSVLALRGTFGNSLDKVVNGRLGGAANPSKIIDAATNIVIRT